MNRGIVSVEILLLSLVGIPFVVGGILLVFQSQVESDAPMSFAEFAWGGIALLIGSASCIGAGCLANRHKPWRPEPPRSSEEEVCPPGKHFCQSCGCREADGSKTCRWCGADQE